MAILGADGSRTLPACATTALLPDNSWANIQFESYEIGATTGSLALDASHITPADTSLPDIRCGRTIVELVNRGTETLANHAAITFTRVDDYVQLQWYSND